ncbi:VTT domain-containing protein [Streptomyces sp. NPDC026673]|uniref:DedA family protein n=1 Tax=Streptomyces sp. NPDC026673 TaxID=3155724 RepID=UPI0033E49F07
MFIGAGSLFDSPWIYALVAASIVLDVFLPVMPSGVLLISAVTAGTAADGNDVLEVIALLLCAAVSSTLGDLAAYRLAWRGGDWIDQHVAHSRRLSTAQDILGTVLARGGGALVVLARFAPAGRSVVSLTAGAAHRRIREFLPWSALAGLAWAAYSVGLGYAGGQWLGAGWLGTATSAVALVGSGSLAAYVFRRERRAQAVVPVALPAQAAAAPDRVAVAEAR